MLNGTEPGGIYHIIQSQILYVDFMASNKLLLNSVHDHKN